MRAPDTLVADVGGTNTRVAVASDGRVDPGRIRRFPNAAHPSLGDIIAQYLEGADLPRPDRACVAVAGPVRHGVGKMTNLDWTIDGRVIRDASGAEAAYVINDLEAQGHALGDVPTTPVHGDPKRIAGEGSPRLVVGIGTGFNAAPVHHTARGVHVAASECGHISLPVWDEDSFALSGFLRARHGFASVEEALSGRGLETLDEFLGSGMRRSTREIADALQAGGTGSEAAAVTLFCRLLGRVVGDLALIHLPWGGIYLIGGMARLLAPYFSRAGFSEGFHDKGRFSTFLSDFTVFLVDDDDAALTGCLRYAAERA